MRVWPRSPAIAIVASLVLVVGLWSCGGGGGGGGGGGPTPPPPGVTFTGSAAGSNSISLVHANPGDTSRFRVRVQANSVEDLYGVAFDLLFPVTLLEYQGAAEGTFLSASGAGTTMQVFQGAGGRLVAGATRLGAVGGVGGTGTILELEFTLLAAGTGELRFESQQGFDAAGTAISGLSWSGGTLRVVR